MKGKLKERAERIKSDIPALFLALRMPETPRIAIVLAALTVAYALSPIDLVPDFIPVLGYLDDLILLPIMAALTIRLIPHEVMEQCRAESRDMWADGKPKKWYYALPILLIWAIILLSTLRAILL